MFGPPWGLTISDAGLWRTETLRLVSIYMFPQIEAQINASCSTSELPTHAGVWGWTRTSDGKFSGPLRVILVFSDHHTVQAIRLC